MLPSSPDTELTRIKRAETADAVLVRAQCMKITSGVRNMPPPVPVSPDNRPSPAPTPKANGLDGCCGSSSAGG